MVHPLDHLEAWSTWFPWWSTSWSTFTKQWIWSWTHITWRRSVWSISPGGGPTSGPMSPGGGILVLDHLVPYHLEEVRLVPCHLEEAYRLVHLVPCLLEEAWSPGPPVPYHLEEAYRLRSTWSHVTWRRSPGPSGPRSHITWRRPAIPGPCHHIHIAWTWSSHITWRRSFWSHATWRSHISHWSWFPCIRHSTSIKCFSTWKITIRWCSIHHWTHPLVVEGNRQPCPCTRHISREICHHENLIAPPTASNASIGDESVCCHMSIKSTLCRRLASFPSYLVAYQHPP